MHLRATLAHALTAVSIAAPLAVQAQNVCSVSKTNMSCELTIDRSNPVAPPTIQMYSDQTLTVKILNPLPFERYFLDFTTGQAAVTPDVASSILQGLTANLGKPLDLIVSGAPKHQNFALALVQENPLSVCEAMTAAGAGPPTVEQFRDCFAQLSSFALKTYRKLEPLVAPDSLVQRPPETEPDYYVNNQLFITSDIRKYIGIETKVSSKISQLTQSGAPPAPAGLNLTQLGVYQKLIDAVSADLAGYLQRIRDLGPCGFTDAPAATSDDRCSWNAASSYQAGELVTYESSIYVSVTSHAATAATPDADSDNWTKVDVGDLQYQKSLGPPDLSAADGYSAGNVIKYNGVPWIAVHKTTLRAAPAAPDWVLYPPPPRKPLAPILISSRADQQAVYQGMSTRTVTYSLDVLNLVSYSQEAAPSAANKKAIAAIAVNFADQRHRNTALRWEASAGVFFSWLPNRTFYAISNTPSSSSGTASTTYTVQDAKTRPTPVPFAAANYRLTNDFGRVWKQNIYATFAVGVNPNTTTADFGVGPTYAWRLLMVTPFLHIAHDTRVFPNSSPSGNPLAFPTQTHWSPKFAIGISVRVPSLTGR